MATIVGRTQEKQELEEGYSSPEAEFMAVYGRRRVGPSIFCLIALIVSNNSSIRTPLMVFLALIPALNDRQIILITLITNMTVFYCLAQSTFRIGFMFAITKLTLS